MYRFMSLFFCSVVAAQIDQLAFAFKDIDNSVVAVDVKQQAQSYALDIAGNKISQEDLIVIFEKLKKDDLKKILQQKVEVRDVRETKLLTQESLFNVLVQFRKEKIIHYILDNIFIDNINFVDANYYNSLMLAIIYGDVALVKMLLKYGADPCIEFRPKNGLEDKNGIQYESLPLDKLFTINLLSKSIDLGIQNQIIKLIADAKQQKNCL